MLSGLVLSKKKMLFITLFVAYCFFILWMTVIKRDATVREYELELFWGLRMWLNNEPSGLSVFVQYINNILFFVPFGLLLCETVELKWGWVLGLSLAASVCVEITQYITARGLAEIDDVISNTAGAMIGFLLWKMRVRFMTRCGNVR